MSNTRLYKNGKEPSNPKSLTRRDIVRDSAKFKTLEREHDPLRRFGGSVGGLFIDTDGDGSPDQIVRAYRCASAGVGKHTESEQTDPVDPPISGPSGLTATESVPAQGPSGLSASEAVPVSGPSGLTASENAPASGPSGLTATEAVPVSGPSGLTATKLTLNTAPFSTDQDALVATAPAVGTIKYSSDVSALFIYDGTDWHHYK
jgi:hypothetical protein